MSTGKRDGTALLILVLMVVAGIATSCIPLFLTPPAYLDLVLRDRVFDADLLGKEVIVTNDLTGQTVTTAIERSGDAFLARLGRIDSGDGRFSVALDGYKQGSVNIHASPLEKVRGGIDLTPTFGRLEISPVNATRTDEAVPATVKDGSRVLSKDPLPTIIVDLPPGTHRLAASAPGFCDAEREFTVREATVTREAFPLSPDFRGNEIARFILGWPHDPADLDSHFRRVGTTGTRNPEHLFYKRREAHTTAGVSFAQLDVDRRLPRGYETVTVRDTAVGDFEYYVHLFSGQGTLGGSGAMVQVYTRGCQMRTFHVPPDCDQTVWAVTTIRNAGGVHLIERNRCEAGQILQLGGKVPLSASVLQ